MADYGFKVSVEGSSVYTATGAEVLLDFSQPQAKLDVTNPVSFQNVDLTISTNPPGSGSPFVAQETLVYSFDHGYDYTPQFWVLVQVVTPIVTSEYQEIFQDRGILGVGAGFSQAGFLSRADDEKIYFYIEQIQGMAGVVNLVGLQLRIRTYVFVNDLTML